MASLAQDEELWGNLRPLAQKIFRFYALLGSLSGATATNTPVRSPPTQDTALEVIHRTASDNGWAGLLVMMRVSDSLSSCSSYCLPQGFDRAQKYVLAYVERLRSIYQKRTGARLM